MKIQLSSLQLLSATILVIAQYTTAQSQSINSAQQQLLLFQQKEQQEIVSRSSGSSTTSSSDVFEVCNGYITGPTTGLLLVNELKYELTNKCYNGGKCRPVAVTEINGNKIEAELEKDESISLSSSTFKKAVKEILRNRQRLRGISKSADRLLLEDVVVKEEKDTKQLFVTEEQSEEEQYYSCDCTDTSYHGYQCEKKNQ